MQRLHNKTASIRKGNAVIMISILLLISGMALATLFKPQLPQEKEKAKITKERLKVIRQRLYFFRDDTLDEGEPLGMNRSYPCPALMTIPETHADFGKSKCSGVDVVTSGDLLIGAVPVRNLGLANSYAFDGWGRYFRYIRDTNDAASIVVTDLAETGGELLSNELPTLDLSSLVVAVISHGPDGEGAYTRAGNLYAACGNPASNKDGENCDDDVNLIYDKWNEADGYDDFLIGVTVEGPGLGDDCNPVADGIVSGRGNEQCDDGNNTNGDGCDENCQNEACVVNDPGWCSGGGGVWNCVLATCNGSGDYDATCKALYGPTYNYCEGSEMCLEGFC